MRGWLVLILVLSVGLFWVGAKKNHEGSSPKENPVVDNPFPTGSVQAIVHYHENGNIQKKIPLNNGREHGTVVSWYPRGQKESEVGFRHGALHGPATFWYPNGRRRLTCRFHNGEHHGQMIVWNEDGRIVAESFFRQGRLLSAISGG